MSTKNTDSVKYVGPVCVCAGLGCQYMHNLMTHAEGGPEQIKDCPECKATCLFVLSPVDTIIHKRVVDADYKVTEYPNTIPDTDNRHPLIAVRETTHGKYSQTARIAQEIKEIFNRELTNNAGHSGESYEVAESLDLIATKLSRILAGNADSLEHWEDIEGYAHLVVEHLQGKRK